MAREVDSDGHPIGERDPNNYEYKYFDTMPKSSFLWGGNSLYNDGWRFVEVKRVDEVWEDYDDWSYIDNDGNVRQQSSEWGVPTKSRRLISYREIYYCRRIKKD